MSTRKFYRWPKVLVQSIVLLLFIGMAVIGLVTIAPALRYSVVTILCFFCILWLAIEFKKYRRSKRIIAVFYAKRLAMPVRLVYEQSKLLQQKEISFVVFENWWRQLGVLLHVDPERLRLEDNLHKYPWFNEKEGTYSPEEPEDLIAELSGSCDKMEDSIPSTLEGIVCYSWQLQKRKGAI